MFRPFLVVGVGGSGGKTLRSLRHDLLRRLEEVGWSEGLPRAWQLVHIDVPTHQDGDDPDLPEQLPLKDYQGLVASNISYRNLDDSLLRRAGAEARSGLAGWRPAVREVRVPVERGAGQFRALGRMITIANLAQVKKGLERATDELQHPEVPGELGRLAQHFGAEAYVGLPTPTAIVISSIAGGSGAGAVIDVCDVLRGLRPGWGDHSVGLLFAPDVFDEIPVELRRGVRPNALATMSELMAGYWNGEGLSEPDKALMALGNVSAQHPTRLGPRYPLLVGKRSSTVDFGRQIDVYNAMGRAVGAWLSSDVLQDVLSAYFQTNWSNTATAVSDDLPLKSQGQEPPFSAIGFARLSLGRDRLAEYAAQSLARLAVEQLLRAHLATRTRHDERSDEELLVEQVEYSFGPFLAASGLHQRGREHNDVVRALTGSPERNSRLRALESDVMEQVRRSAGQQARDRRWWRDRIVGLVREVSGDAVRTERDAVHAIARTWVPEQEERLTALVASTIADQGAAVTARLLARLRDEVSAVLLELPAEIETYSRYESLCQQEIDAHLAAPGAAQLPATHSSVSLAVEEAVKLIRCRAEVITREVALELLRDLVTSLLQPLEGAVADAHQKLKQAESGKVEGRHGPVQSWGTVEAVPVRLAPARNEFLLEPVEDFPSARDRLLVGTTGVADVGGARRRAVQEIILHSRRRPSGGKELSTRNRRQPSAPGSTDQVQRLILTASHWVPRLPEVRAQLQDVPSRAKFALQLEPDAVLERAQAWTARPDTEMGRHLAESLGEYLEDSDSVEPVEHARRISVFEGKLQAALDAAAPLVDVNAGVLSVVHHRTAPPANMVVSGMPFPVHSDAYETATRVLLSRGVRGEEAKRSFRELHTSSVDIFTVQGEPYQPVVFDSLMRPLAEEWGARSGSVDGRASFWQWRRARPLPEFVPVDPRVRAAMVRGWFTARLLGQLRLPDDGRTSILVPRSGRPTWQAFPFPTLTPARPTAPFERLPIVLESLPLAFLEVNREASLAPMEPYRRLLELGTSATGAEERYDELNRELYEWIVAGTCSDAADVLDAGASRGVDLATRRQAVVSHLQELQGSYEGLFRDTDADEVLQRVPLVWELRDDVTNALHDLVLNASAVAESVATRW